MWVVNNKKERVKIYLRNDIESNITNITDASNRIHDIIAAINTVSAGTVTGIDRQMIGDCQRVLQELSAALQKCYIGQNYVDQLETREWVDDE